MASILLLINTMTKWNSNMPWQTDNYVLRCTEELFGMSKGSENPMITLTYEVVSPEEIEIAGEATMVVGTRIVGYYTTMVLNGEGDLAEKTTKAQNRVRELYSLFGLDNTNINFENPVLGFKGKLVHARLYDDEQVKYNSPTSEDLKAGNKRGKPAVNPITKQPLTQHYPKIECIFGLAEVESGKAY